MSAETLCVQKHFFNAKEVVSMTGLSRATLYRYMDNGQFPQNVKLGPGRVAWRQQDVMDWIAQI